MNGKTFVVTGASLGIGLETARGLARDGATVVSLDIRPSEQPVGRYIQVDLSDQASIDGAIAELPDRIDGLCNVAGLPGNQPTDLVMRVNFLGARHLTEAVSPRLAPGGCIANVASGAGLGWRDRLEDLLAFLATPSYASGLEWLRSHPIDQPDAYPFSKEAMTVWTMQCASRLQRAGIRVNVVSPGPISTRMLPALRDAVGDQEADKVINWAGRAGKAAEVADVLLFLCSEQARWVSGANIPVDAGLSAKQRISVAGA